MPPIPRPGLPKPRGGRATPVTTRPNGNPLPGSPGWKAFTAKRWAAKHQQQIANAAMPRMESDAEIRAKANAQSWKSIQQMMQTLPSDEQIAAQYGPARTQIAGLVEAHRAWLEKAGQYQTQTAQALGGMVQNAAQGADQFQGAQAAAAGAPIGSAPSTNMTPEAAGTPMAYGSNFGAYLSALVPSASAVGAANLSALNTSEAAAHAGLASDRKSISSNLLDLQDKNYQSGYEIALDKYKSELAALAAGQKGSLAKAKLDLDQAKAVETARYHTGQLGLSEDRNKISRSRANAAWAKVNQTTGADDKRTAGDASGLKSALAAADLMMHPKAGASGRMVPSAYGITLKIPGSKDPDTLEVIPPKTFPIRGGSVAEVRKVMNAFLKKHHNEGWLIPGNITALANEKKPEGTAAAGDQYELRQKAWRYLSAQNAASLHPVSQATLLAMFRRMEGAP